MKKITLALIALAMMATTAAVAAPAAEAAEGDTIHICTKTKTKNNGATINIVKISERDDHGGFACEDVQCTVEGRFCLIKPEGCDIKKTRRVCRTTAELNPGPAPIQYAPAMDYPEITNAPTFHIHGDIQFDQAELDAFAASYDWPDFVAHPSTPGNVDPEEWAAYLAG